MRFSSPPTIPRTSSLSIRDLRHFDVHVNLWCLFLVIGKKGKAVVFELWISERIWQDQGQKVKLRFKSFLSKRIFRNLLILFFMSWGKVLRRGNKCYHNVVSELNRFAGATIQDKFYLASATIILLLVMLLNKIIMLMFDCVPWLISDKQKLILKKVSFESIELCFK